MFFVVQLDSDIFDEKIIVPSIWLDKYNTLCLLPPTADITEVERIARTQIAPTHGWQMHSVLFLQSFDTYSQAEDNIRNNREEPEMVELEENEEEPECHQRRGREARKRKRPTYLENYSTETDGEEEGRSTMPSNFSVEGGISMPGPCIIKMEPMEDIPPLESHHQRRRDTTDNSRNFSKNSHPKVSQSCSSNVAQPMQRINTKCQCNSSCHKVILQSLAIMQRQLEENSRMLHKLMGRPTGNPGSSLNVVNNLPGAPATLPERLTEQSEPQSFDNYLHDQHNFTETMKVLIQFKSTLKVRKIRNHESLIEAIESAFDLDRNFLSLQIFDEDLQEYVDFEDISSLKDKCRIKVVDLRENTIYESSDTLQNCHETEQRILPIIEDAENVEVILNLKPQWPSSVILPTNDFSDELREALEKKRDLNWKQSYELVDHLANYAYSFSRYPNKTQRIEICQALINKFPHLKDNVGLGYDGWEIKLLNKLKRMRMNDLSLEVTLNKEKRKSLDSTMPKNIKVKPGRGEVNWAPDHIEGEDEISQNMHRQIMMEESKKTIAIQDKSKLKALMALTYSFRRSAINNKINIKHLKQQYPIFFQIEDQFDEFERLTSVKIRSTFFKEAETNGCKLLNLFMEKKSDLLKQIKENVEIILKSVERKEVQTVNTSLGLYVLPCLLKESLEHFVEIVPSDVETEELASIPPKIFSMGGIVSSSRFIIVAENEVLCQTSDFVTAVGILLSFYYTMDIDYPKEIDATLKFLQHYFLKINGGNIPIKNNSLYRRMMAVK